MMIILASLVLMSGCTFQHGSSRDIVQGWDKGIIWNHAYLKNDHTTAYCFDSYVFAEMLDESQRTQKEVIITYETYFLRGWLCSTSEKHERVIITDVRWAE